MKVERLMTKAVRCCPGSSTLNEAARIMWENDCGFVPILDSDGTNRVIGVITDRDICMAAYTQGKGLKEVRVEKAMHRAVRTCKPSDPVAKAEAVMQEGHVRRLPVVDAGGDLLGVISLSDIAREAVRSRGSRRRDVTNARVGETLALVCQPSEP
jgi:CBS domain-containing protein